MYVVRYIVYWQAVIQLVNTSGIVTPAGRHAFYHIVLRPIIVSNQGRNLRMHWYLYIYIVTYLPLIPYKMSQVSMNVTADKLYEEAFSIKYAWEHMLPKEVFEYHNLIFRECNVPVDLQMGTILPFVASCLGPNTKGLFLT